MKSMQETADVAKGKISKEKRIWRAPEIHRIEITTGTTAKSSVGLDGGGLGYTSS